MIVTEVLEARGLLALPVVSPWFVVVDVVTPVLRSSRPPHSSVSRHFSANFPRLVEVDLDQVVRLLLDGVVRHSELHLHVVGGAEAPDPPVEIPPGGGGDEVVVLARLELHPSWCGGEGPEGDGEVHEGAGLVADGHYLGSGACHTTGLELLLGDAVDDVLLLGVFRTDQVELVVLPGKVPGVDVQHVILRPELGVGGVPVEEVCLHGRGGPQ